MITLDHINISAPMELLDSVKDFYCFIFDMQTEYRPSINKKGYWLYADDKALIHLSESDQHCKNEKPVHLDHIAFKLHNINTVASRLELLKIPYTSQKISDIQLNQLFFHDPSGTRIEINSSN